MNTLKIEINKDVRIGYYEAHEQLDCIQKEIERRVKQEFASVQTKIRDRIDEAFEEKKEFCQRLAEFFKSFDWNTDRKFRVVSQTGKNGSRLTTYEGYFHPKSSANAKRGSYVDFCDPNRNDGKPFTIAFSCCLLSIEEITDQ